jgi:hypothetical protein
VKSEAAAGGNDVFQWRAAGVGGAENAADARAGDVGDGNAMLFEGLQDTEVGKSAREAAS